MSDSPDTRCLATSPRHGHRCALEAGHDGWHQRYMHDGTCPDNLAWEQPPSTDEDADARADRAFRALRLEVSNDEIYLHFTAAVNDAIDRAQSERNAALAERDEAEARADAALAEVERLREALGFYADERNWFNGTPGEWTVEPGHPGSDDGFSHDEFEHDHGERARAALRASRSTSEGSE